MKLIIEIPEELYEAYKGKPPMLGDAGMDMIAQAIANGTPIKTVTNAEEAEAYNRYIKETEYKEFMYNRDNIHNCENCPENKGFGKRDYDDRWPCLQYHCWVELTAPKEA